MLRGRAVTHTIIDGVLVETTVQLGGLHDAINNSGFEGLELILEETGDETIDSAQGFSQP